MISNASKSYILIPLDKTVKKNRPLSLQSIFAQIALNLYHSASRIIFLSL